MRNLGDGQKIFLIQFNFCKAKERAKNPLQ